MMMVGSSTVAGCSIPGNPGVWHIRDLIIDAAALLRIFRREVMESRVSAIAA